MEKVVNTESRTVAGNFHNYGAKFHRFRQIIYHKIRITKISAACMY